MNNYFVRKVLDKKQIEYISNVIDICNKKNLWIDGLNSGGGTKKTKNNLELNDLNYSKQINDVIMESLDKDINFFNFVVPKTTMLNIISKTESGGYYNPHIDNWDNGDYSTTIFLNDPNEYEGGELCLYFGGEEETKIKLDSGYGVTYPTGILHRVNKVKSGVRYVSVFWTQSLIKDQFIRSIYSEISNVELNILNNSSPIHVTNCYSSLKDPIFSLNNIKTQILRKYSSI